MSQNKLSGCVKILFVSDHLSYTNGAGSLSRAHLECLINIVGRENVYVMSLAFAASKYDLQSWFIRTPYRNKFEKLKNIVSLNHIDINNKVIEECVRIVDLNEIQYVFVDESYFGKLVRTLKRRTNAKIFTFYHDVKANLYREWMKKERKRRIPEFLAGILNEKWNARYADYNVVLNERERMNFNKAYAKDSDFSIPIILPGQSDIVIEKRVQKKLRIGFLGAYYYPNVSGITWFCKSVMPFIEDFAELFVAGKGMETLKDSLEGMSASIQVIGTLESVSDFYNGMDLIAAPIFEGAGMKVKTAEAFSYGKAFVGTSESLIGYEDILQDKFVKQFIIECDTDTEFINAIKRLQDAMTQNGISEIRRGFEKFYSYSAAEKILKDYIR